MSKEKYLEIFQNQLKQINELTVVSTKPYELINLLKEVRNMVESAIADLGTDPTYTTTLSRIHNLYTDEVSSIEIAGKGVDIMRDLLSIRDYLLRHLDSIVLHLNK